MASEAQKKAQLRYDAKRQNNIAFRLTDEQERKLTSMTRNGESRHQAAKRLLVSALNEEEL